VVMTLHDDLPPIPPRTFLDSLKAYWPIITAIVVAGWVAFTWLADQRKLWENRRVEAEKLAEVRLFEARKPFLDKQLQLYFETAQVVGRLVTLDRQSGAWSENAQRYRALYWSELSMVEHKIVETAMVRFGAILDLHERTGRYKSELEFRSYCLAHAIRDAIQDAWTVGISRSDVPKVVSDRVAAANPTGSPPASNCSDEPITK